MVSDSIQQDCMYRAVSGWLDTARLDTLNITNIINNRLQVEAGYMHVARLCSKTVRLFLLLPRALPVVV